VEERSPRSRARIHHHHGLHTRNRGAPLVDANLDDATQIFLAGRHALGRLDTPGEVSALVCFLASDAATFITGSCHLVDGGYAAQ
jgi:NAD(P)-dependent dehydrogenase (short-subunit alcohol dehydrogenase family)